MPIVSLARLSSDRPNWLPFAGAQLHQLEEGASTPARVSDAPEAFLVVEGEIHLFEGKEAHTVAAGQVACIEPGTLFAIQRVNKAAKLLQLYGELLPPFRPEPIAPSEVATVPLQPVHPLASPVREGFSVTIDPCQTFSPSFLGQGEGAGLVLTCDVANTPRNLLQEVRKHCYKEAIMVAGLIVPLDGEKAMEDFVRLPDVTTVAFSLHPFLMGVEADLSTESGRATAKIMRRYFSMRLGLNGIKPCVRMELGNWDDATCAMVFHELHRLPPRRFGLILTLGRETDIMNRRTRRILRALDPWVGVLETVSTEQRDAASHLLDSYGSQSWVLIRK